MITTSDAYKAAIDAPTRQIIPKAIIDVSDPDLELTAVSGDTDAAYSFDSQLIDKDMDFSGMVFATLEPCRWLLDGGQNIMPDDPTTRDGEQGVWGDGLCGTDGTVGQSVEVTFTGVDTLQVVTVAATGQTVDGYPSELILNVYSGALLLHTQTVEPTGSVYRFEGFTAIQPNKIELVVEKWSLPKRRFRFIEILPGMIETWGGETIFKMHIQQQADFSNLTLPYATASLEINNVNKRFDPANKESLFASITARQPVPLFYGVKIGDGVEYVPCGVYYQQNQGWAIDNDGMTIRWDLIDIIGLLADRQYVPPPEPEPVPVGPGQYAVPPITMTLEAWIEHIVNQFDEIFENHFNIDPSVASESLTAYWADINNLTCGDMLRFVCQATNSYPVSNPVTGYLDVKVLDGTPTRLTDLRMQNSRPGSEENTEIAFLSYDIGGTLYNVPGTEEISDKTVNVKNPFISTTMDAVKSAQVVLTQYGGNVLNVICRGDPSRQMGDVETVEVYPEEYVAGRVMNQTLSLEGGVMTNQQVRYLQANGGQLYTDVIIIDQDGTYTMPAGVTEITLVLVGGGDGGQGGRGGADGYFTDRNGTGGAGGLGGKVYSTPLSINDSQQYTVHIGAGGRGGQGGAAADTPYRPAIQGRPGDPGEATTATFGAVFTSANGVNMSTGYVDLLTNAVYGVPGQEGKEARKIPVMGANGSFYGNGGQGGGGGAGSIWDPEPTFYENGVIVEHAVPGAAGGKGANGVVLIFYSR